AVEVALEVEEVRLDPALGAAVVRVDADRHRGALLSSRAGVDPERGNEQRGIRTQVRRGEAERAPARVARDDRSLHLDRPAEERRGAPHLPGGGEPADLGRGDARDVRDDVRAQPELLEQSQIAAPAAAEAEALPRDDDLGADPLEVGAREL